MPHHPRARYWGYPAYPSLPKETQNHLEATRGAPCYLCGTPWGEREMEVEHKTPKCRGGGDEPENIGWACFPCNRRKHRMTEAEFRNLLAQEGE